MSKPSAFALVAVWIVGLVAACGSDDHGPNAGAAGEDGVGGRNVGGTASGGQTSPGGRAGAAGAAGTSVGVAGYAGAIGVAVGATSGGGSHAGGSASGGTTGGVAGDSAGSAGASSNTGGIPGIGGAAAYGGAAAGTTTGAGQSSGGLAGAVNTSAAGHAGVAGTSQAGLAGKAAITAAGAASTAGSAPFANDPRCPTVSPTATLTSHLKITADNECNVFVNGQAVGQTTNWGSAVTLDVSLFVHPGRKNVVAVVGRNTSSQNGNDRGIIGELTTTVGTTTSALLVTDRSWRVTESPGADWYGFSYDDSTWVGATEVAVSGDSPWGAVMGTGSTAKWIWFAPIPESTSAKPNLEATYARRSFYFDFAGQLTNAPLCNEPGA